MGQKFNFKRLDEPFEADWPVIVRVPQDGGGTTVEEFMARFRIVRDQDDAPTPPPPDVEAIADAEQDPKEALSAARRALRQTVLDEWRRWFVGFGKPTSEEEELTDEVLWHIVTTPYTRLAVQAAYKSFCEGVAVKN